MKQFFGGLALSVPLLGLLDSNARDSLYRVGRRLRIFLWIGIWVSAGHIGDVAPYGRLIYLWYSGLELNGFALTPAQGSKLPGNDIVTSHGSPITDRAVYKSQALWDLVGDNHVSSVFV